MSRRHVRDAIQFSVQGAQSFADESALARGMSVASRAVRA